MNVDIVLNGKTIKARPGQTILGVAAENGIRVPTLCHHKDLSPSGNCRMCVVEIQGSRVLQAACVTPVSKDMVIITDSEKVIRDRRLTLALMMANHTANCSYCDVSGDCELQDLVYEYQVDAPAWGIKGTRFPIDSYSNRYIHVDLNKCVLCRRCVQACAEIQVRDVLGVANRGFGAQIVAGTGTTLEEARCEWCGQCVAYCPTGALSSKTDYGRQIAKAHQINKTTTTCPHCAVGCQFDLVVRRNRLVGVASNPRAPVNGMALCVKGRFEYDLAQHAGRLKKPRIRRYLLEGGTKQIDAPGWEWAETDWETALGIAASKLAEASRKFGSAAVGLLSSGKCLNEENYLMNKLARQVLRTNNIDHLASVDQSEISAGLAATLGSAETTNSLKDVAEQSQAFLVIGSNTTVQHPVFGTQLRRAVRFRGAKLILADPQDIDLADFAAIQLRHLPGSDTSLICGLMYIILEKGWEDRRFISERTEGFEALKAKVMDFPPTQASLMTGIPVLQLYEVAEILAKRRPAAVICGRGIARDGRGRQHAMELVALQLLLGNVGVPGGGLIHLQGQTNAQGASDMGALPAHFPGGRAVADAEARASFSSSWGLATGSVMQQSGNGRFAAQGEPGLTAQEMLLSGEDGAIRALYLVGADPITDLDDGKTVRDSLGALEFLAVQDVVASPVANYADVLLPSVSFAEKTGTFTNTERRVQLVRQATLTTGDSRPDWWIISELARRILKDRPVSGLLEAPYSGWAYADTADVMSEISSLVPAYGGVTHQRLMDGEELQLPCPSEGHPGTRILHQQAFPRGRAALFPIELAAPGGEDHRQLQPA